MEFGRFNRARAALYFVPVDEIRRDLAELRIDVDGGFPYLLPMNAVRFGCFCCGAVKDVSGDASMGTKRIVFDVVPFLRRVRRQLLVLRWVESVAHQVLPTVVMGASCGYEDFAQRLHNSGLDARDIIGRLCSIDCC